MNIGDRVVEIRKRGDDALRPSPIIGEPDVLVAGVIQAEADPEPCGACGGILPTDGKWKIAWDDSRQTVQHEDSLRLFLDVPTSR